MYAFLLFSSYCLYGIFPKDEGEDPQWVSLLVTAKAFKMGTSVEVKVSISEVFSCITLSQKSPKFRKV
jgi:hypothetical protein